VDIRRDLIRPGDDDIARLAFGDDCRPRRGARVELGKDLNKPILQAVRNGYAGLARCGDGRSGCRRGRGLDPNAGGARACTCDTRECERKAQGQLEPLRGDHVSLAEDRVAGSLRGLMAGCNIDSSIRSDGGAR
jgi:hypothetical protein